MFDGVIGNKALSININQYGLYMQNTFTLGKKGTSAELSGWFNGPGIWGGTWKTKPQGGFDIGVQQSLLKKKATVKVAWTDVLHTMPWRSESDFGGLYIKGNGSWESTTFRLSLSWRFGSNDVKQARQRKTGLETEKGRIKAE